MAVFPGDLIFVPRRVAERVANIQRWKVMAAGGHFAAAEEPAAVAGEVREFFRQFRAKDVARDSP
jgi:microsomal epoxide hydrolase